MASRVIETEWSSKGEAEYLAACERVRHEMELLTAAANAVRDSFAQVNACMERYIDLSGQLSQRSFDPEREGQYTVTKMAYDETGLPLRVAVSFEMPYRGWCKLQTSTTWARLLVSLADAQSIQDS